MQVGIIGDSHFDERSRFEECIRLHSRFAVGIAARRVDLVIHTGDVYERASTPVERLRVAEWVRLIADTCPIVIIRGNHDRSRDLALLEQLETRHPVHVVETPRLLDLGCAIVQCVPWPRKAVLTSWAAQQENLDTAEGVQLVGRDALRAILDHLGTAATSSATSSTPVIGAMHAMVSGCITSTGQPLVGCDMEVALDDLALLRSDFIALGHVHKPQEWEHRGIPIAFTGSARRTAYGEVEDKSWILATFDSDPEQMSWERISLGAQRMLLIEDEWEPDNGFDGQGWPGPADMAGADIRFRYHFATDQAASAHQAARLTADFMEKQGATAVKLDPVPRATTRKREGSAAVARACTVQEKLEGLWSARGEEISDQRRQRLGVKLSELEGGLQV